MANLAVFRIGYGVKLAVPLSAVQNLLNVLNISKVVDDRWVDGHTPNQVYVVDSDAAITMTLVPENHIVSEETYGALVVDVKARKEAAASEAQ